LRTVRAWLAEKHVGIAQFYRVLNNRDGEHHHLLLAVTKFPLMMKPAAATLNKPPATDTWFGVTFRRTSTRAIGPTMRS
ncbi:MAG: hypothetical protein IH921_09025, partial [Gemmatimonadetes bacterium]|nr:hypothetical protein [Gemmatimonadota bacterium]